METLTQLKTRFAGAFRRYSSQNVVVRRLVCANGGPLVPDSRNMGAERRKLLEVERDYREVRREYVERLLAGRLRHPARR